MDKGVLFRNICALQEELSRRVGYINSGGCVHFAYFLSERLTELGVEHKIGYHNYNKIDMRYRNMTSINHVTVYIDGIGFVDGDETMNKVYSRYKRVEKTSLKKLNFYRQNCDWNPCYDTRQNMVVRNLINKHIV